MRVLTGIFSVCLSLAMTAVVAQRDGQALCRGQITGKAREAAALGRNLAERLLRDGADKLLAEH